MDSWCIAEPWKHIRRLSVCKSCWERSAYQNTLFYTTINHGDQEMRLYLVARESEFGWMCWYATKETKSSLCSRSMEVRQTLAESSYAHMANNRRYGYFGWKDHSSRVFIWSRIIIIFGALFKPCLQAFIFEGWARRFRKSPPSTQILTPDIPGCVLLLPPPTCSRRLHLLVPPPPPIPSRFGRGCLRWTVPTPLMLVATSRLLSFGRTTSR